MQDNNNKSNNNGKDLKPVYKNSSQINFLKHNYKKDDYARLDKKGLHIKKMINDRLEGRTDDKYIELEVKKAIRLRQIRRKA